MVWFHIEKTETLQEGNVTKNDGQFLIPMMDPPMENTKAVTEDGIPDRIIDLQEPSNRRTVANSVELFCQSPGE